MEVGSKQRREALECCKENIMGHSSGSVGEENLERNANDKPEVSKRNSIVLGIETVCILF